MPPWGHGVGTEASVQAEGAALRVPADELRVAFDHSPCSGRCRCAPCPGRAGRGVQRPHAADKPLVRRLLMAHDRADGAEFPMTQEFMR